MLHVVLRLTGYCCPCSSRSVRYAPTPFQGANDMTKVPAVVETFIDHLAQFNTQRPIRFKCFVTDSVSSVRMVIVSTTLPPSLQPQSYRRILMSRVRSFRLSSEFMYVSQQNRSDGSVCCKMLVKTRILWVDIEQLFEIVLMLLLLLEDYQYNTSNNNNNNNKDNEVHKTEFYRRT